MSNPTSTKKDQDRAGDALHSAANQASSVASSVADKARDAAGAVADKAKDAYNAAAGQASGIASSVGDAASHATSSVGGGLRSAAGTVRDQGPSSGYLGSATDAVADAMEGTGRYLQDKNLSGMADDLTGLIRNNPIPALLIGLGVGFLLGRSLRS